MNSSRAYSGVMVIDRGGNTGGSGVATQAHRFKELDEGAYKLSVVETFNDAGSFTIEIPLDGTYFTSDGREATSGAGSQLFHVEKSNLSANNNAYMQSTSYLSPASFHVCHAYGGPNLLLNSQKCTSATRNGKLVLTIEGTLGNGFLADWRAFPHAAVTTADFYTTASSVYVDHLRPFDWFVSNVLNARPKTAQRGIIPTFTSSIRLAGMPSDITTPNYPVSGNRTVLDCLKEICGQNVVFMTAFDTASNTYSPLDIFGGDIDGLGGNVVFTENEVSDFSFVSTCPTLTTLAAVAGSPSSNPASCNNITTPAPTSDGFYSEGLVTASSASGSNTVADNQNAANSAFASALFAGAGGVSINAVIASNNSNIVYGRDYLLGDHVTFDVGPFRVSAQVITHSFTLGGGDYQEAITLGGISSWGY